MDGEGWEKWYLLLEAAGLINLVLFSFINLLNKMYWLSGTMLGRYRGYKVTLNLIMLMVLWGARSRPNNGHRSKVLESSGFLPPVS